MPSETDLLNEALARVGADRISAIDDGSPNANHCQTMYPGTRDALLRMAHWNFATGRAALVLNVEVPLFEFQFSYKLPDDWLKMRLYNGGPVNTTGLTWSYDTGWPSQWWARYVIEDKNLLSNDSPALIVYTKRVVDCAQWDSLFYQTCVTWLAGKLADAIPKDSKKSAMLIQEAVNLHLPMALAADGQEGTVVPFVTDELTRGR